LSMDDVESTWAGLRPLIEEEGKSASELSRKDEIFESPSGLLSIAGGKLTGYRKMAERIIDRVAKKAENEWDLQLKPCATDNIILGGGIFKSGQEVDQYINEIRQKLADYGIDQYAEYLVGNYGRQTNQILTFLETELGGDNEVNLALSELAFTLEHEAVFTLLDFFERRTGRLYFNINSIPKLITPICDEMQRCLGWDALRRSQEEATLSQAMIAASDF
ncbi:MAG: glycerol-3-phosphate dehydrogenase, partial [Cyclobacteriaceae bacterium]|nr:glycerol-3-phosphate dehydrogenase [Cyclobacteriaceae bacterium HetDA_MAG_MS6]